MPIPFVGKIAVLPAIFCLLVLLGTALAPDVHAIDENRPLHRSANREVWDRKSNRVELFGNAVVRQPGENLSADYIVVDMNNRTLDARGNCVYIASDSVIYGEEMHFNLDTRTGTIIGGRVANEKFSLAGERINKLGEGRFQSHWGEYTTCQDCPQSWEFQAEDVDMQFEGYAFMSNVNVKLKDAPAFWLPYLVIPLKSERQSGLLFPTISVSGVKGFAFVQPYFWAINRSSDMTLGAGIYTARGLRGEWQGRYALSNRSGGTANAFYLSDKNPDASKPSGYGKIDRTHRWAVDISQVQELPFGIEQKLKLTEMSDNTYPIQIGDVAQGGAGGWNNEPFVPSDLSFTFGSPYFRGYLAGRRFRNLLPIDPNESVLPGNVERVESNQFDQRTVQVLPAAVVTTNDKLIAGTPVAAGFTLGLMNFARGAGPTDPDSQGANSGNPVLREATRFAISPSLYTTYRPWDALSVVPSINYRGLAYSFHSAAPNLYRQYLLFQADISTQLERVYETSDEQVPRVKHLIRPRLTYSLIPYFREPTEHPFVGQIQAQPGYQFDNLDLVPLDSDPTNFTYTPLGHSIEAAVTTDLIQRRGAVSADEPSYLKMLEFTAAQAVNLRALGKGIPDEAVIREPLSRFFASLDANLDNRWISSATYYYYPFEDKIKPHQLSTSLTYILERGVKQRVLDFDRSVSFGYSYNRVDCKPTDALNCGTSDFRNTIRFSLSDYLLPSITYAYSFLEKDFMSANLNLLYQSPSRCWRVSLNLGYTRSTRTTQWSPDLTLNLTGAGFGGVSELTTLGTPSQTR